MRLLEIKMKRILRFNEEEAEEKIAALGRKIAATREHLDNIVAYAIDWYTALKNKYGHAYPRRTVVRGFDSIEAANVAEATEKLYINREEGFIGTGLKKDEFVCNCSDIDDVILFYKDGRYKIVKVQEKLFVDKGVIYINVFKRKDERTIYNVIYQNGKGGTYMMKRFAATGLTRDKEYNVVPGDPVPAGSRIVWFSANPNGEAEVVKVILKPKRGLKKLQFDVDFADMKPKGRGAMGNIVTRNEVQRFTLKGRGVSTLDDLKVWFDPDVLRLNYEGRGNYLGEFAGDDQVLVITKSGEFYTTGFAATNHYDDNILCIEKFEPDKVWTAILNDADQGYPYIKRFRFEPSARKQRYLTDNEKSTLIALSDAYGAMFRVTFADPDDFRDPVEIDADEFIGIKSFKARGKRLTTYTIGEVEELEPKPAPVSESDMQPTDEGADETAGPDEKSDDELRDEFSGQQRLFD